MVKVATLNLIPEGACRVVEVEGTKIALFNYQARLYAIANACLHEGGPLGDGEVYGSRVVCPLHGWEYDFTTGCSVDDPAMRLRQYAVTVAGDDVMLEI
jgi:nitrite reductase/ring-hydroxylating ferredoxin subunit